MTRRRWLCAFIVFLAAVLLPVAGADDARRTGRIVILHTNDLHGAVYPADVRGPDGKVTGRRGGLPAALAYVKQVRAEARRAGDEVFLIDAGDFFQGTPEGDLPEGRLFIHLMNLAGYDFLVPGNHDFDQGPATTEALARRARFPFVCANVFREGPARVRPDWVQPWVLQEAHGLRLAFVGLITSEMPIVTTPNARKGLDFADEMETLLTVLPQLDVDEKPDLKILVTHCGAETDKRIAGTIPELALVVGGHSHTPIEQGWRAPGTGTLVVQSGSSARWIGRVDLVVDLDTRKLVSSEARLVPLDLDDVGEDPDALALVAGFAPDIDRLMNEEVGSAAGPIGRDGGVGSSPLGNLLTDIMRAATGVQIALQNRTGIRADLPPGAQRMRDMYKVSPFSNTLVTMELTGADVLELLERGVSDGTRYLLEASGLVVRFDPSAPAGSRIRKATLKGADGAETPIEPLGKYTVVTNSFLAKGGDGHVPFTRGTAVKETGIDVLAVQVEHFRKHSPVAAPVERRIGAE